MTGEVERMSPHYAAAVVNNVLTRLVRDVLTLSPEHRARLRARGLGADEITRSRYVSVPASAAARQRSADALAPYLDAFGGGVPGFYRDGGRWRMVYRPPGFFIPVRDPLGHIQALSQRVDDPREGGGKYIWLSSADRDGGASSGAPVHFAGRDLLYGAAEVTVTEGALKADVAAHLSGAPVVGVAGTHAFRGLAQRLRTGYPLLRRALVAYDNEMYEKPQVLAATLRLVAQLEAEGFSVRVRTWPGEAKGYDDYLLEQTRTRGVAA
jgi:hypothetical protein